MKILHYSLGLPPYRSGGLTKYSIDLMEIQVKMDNEVYLLFPGKMNGKRVEIKYYKNFNGIEVYEYINPLPVPLLNGVKQPSVFMKRCDKNEFYNFLQKIKPDIIHLHTLMGLNKEFIEVCKEMNIKVVFTTHDYYGLCMKVNFIDYNFNLCEKRNIDKCARCNQCADSIDKIKFLQSAQYRYAKNIGVVNILKKLLSNRKTILPTKKEDEDSIEEEIVAKYNGLYSYYEEMFKNLDLYLFNSKISEKIYNKYIDESVGKVIPITHNDIIDRRKRRKYQDKLNLLYMGKIDNYKGTDILINTMRRLTPYNIMLNIYGDNSKAYEFEKNVQINGVYTYEDIENIFSEADMLVMPSRCFETFGFVALEAICHGVPVMLTENVGASCLISDINPIGCIVEPTEQSLTSEILKIYKNRDILSLYNENICKGDFQFSIKRHYKEIMKSYYDLLGGNNEDSDCFK